MNNTSAAAEIEQLISTLKRELKKQGKTYRDVAAALGLSEPSVKRLFTSGKFSIGRLVQLSHILGFTLAELAQNLAAIRERIRTLNLAQELDLVSDERLLLVAVCTLNHWCLDDIVRTYRLTPAECLQKMLQLDRLGLIAVLPGNRIRLNIARDFDWIMHGPIKRYFQNQGLHDFLNAAFVDNEETMVFSHGMLTESAIAKLQAEVRHLKIRFAELHEESRSAPLAKRRGTGLLVALREW